MTIEYLTKIASLMKLEDGWAGNGSVAPTAAALLTARNILPSAMEDGGIQLDIRAGGIEVEIDIGPDGKVVGVFCAPAPPPSSRT